ncbi:MAG: glyoxalase [Alphaproteobacteria bacterium]|nr:glyoxalase [Alphaproteobacteria bacterium]
MSKPYPFFWYELLTSDRAAAERFYTQVVGWTAEPFSSSGPAYTVLKVGDRGIGGVMTMPEAPAAAGAKPFWGGYILVPDTDAAAAAIEAARGAIHHAPADIPEVGRFAVVSDPQGAMFNLLKPNGPDQPPLAGGTTGTVGWHELYTTDEKAAFDFYAAQFGWREVRAMEMGEMGTYRVFDFGGGEMGNGGMMNHPQPGAPSSWLFYFNVDGIDAATERVKAGGGELLMGPMEVPGGSWVIQANDPQGARFALVSLKR